VENHPSVRSAKESDTPKKKTGSRVAQVTQEKKKKQERLKKKKAGMRKERERLARKKKGGTGKVRRDVSGPGLG